ncbi:hypothetical protein F511_23482 [Dorcoceras hygrometricum]|uniref:Uncharacterized protein n=1 Tax=Dorcoceras hygrometricum TaxID=472368 RepID=A0A2Z7B7N5_9LAMI|nr:hypothetical protein F511_23482 [Dorcoceras hygrometricum]
MEAALWAEGAEVEASVAGAKGLDEKWVEETIGFHGDWSENDPFRICDPKLIRIVVGGVVAGLRCVWRSVAVGDGVVGLMAARLDGRNSCVNGRGMGRRKLATGGDRWRRWLRLRVDSVSRTIGTSKVALRLMWLRWMFGLPKEVLFGAAKVAGIGDGAGEKAECGHGGVDFGDGGHAGKGGGTTCGIHVSNSRWGAWITRNFDESICLIVIFEDWPLEHAKRRTFFSKRLQQVIGQIPRLGGEAV